MARVPKQPKDAMRGPILNGVVRRAVPPIALPPLQQGGTPPALDLIPRVASSLPSFSTSFPFSLPPGVLGGGGQTAPAATPAATGAALGGKARSSDLLARLLQNLDTTEYETGGVDIPDPFTPSPMPEETGVDQNDRDLIFRIASVMPLLGAGTAVPGVIASGLMAAKQKAQERTQQEMLRWQTENQLQRTRYDDQIERARLQQQGASARNQTARQGITDEISIYKAVRDAENMEDDNERMRLNAARSHLEQLRGITDPLQQEAAFLAIPAETRARYGIEPQYDPDTGEYIPIYSVKAYEAMSRASDRVTKAEIARENIAARATEGVRNRQNARDIAAMGQRGQDRRNAANIRSRQSEGRLNRISRERAASSRNRRLSADMGVLSPRAMAAYEDLQAAVDEEEKYLEQHPGGTADDGTPIEDDDGNILPAPDPVRLEQLRRRQETFWNQAVQELDKVGFKWVGDRYTGYPAPKTGKVPASGSPIGGYLPPAGAGAGGPLAPGAPVPPGNYGGAAAAPAAAPPPAAPTKQILAPATQEALRRLGVLPPAGRAAPPKLNRGSASPPKAPSARPGISGSPPRNSRGGGPKPAAVQSGARKPAAAPVPRKGASPPKAKSAGTKGASKPAGGKVIRRGTVNGIGVEIIQE